MGQKGNFFRTFSMKRYFCFVNSSPVNAQCRGKELGPLRLGYIRIKLRLFCFVLIKGSKIASSGLICLIQKANPTNSNLHI